MSSRYQSHHDAQQQQQQPDQPSPLHEHKKHEREREHCVVCGYDGHLWEECRLVSNIMMEYHVAAKHSSQTQLEESQHYLTTLWDESNERLSIKDEIITGLKEQIALLQQKHQIATRSKSQTIWKLKQHNSKLCKENAAFREEMRCKRKVMKEAIPAVEIKTDGIWGWWDWLVGGIGLWQAR